MTFGVTYHKTTLNSRIVSYRIGRNVQKNLQVSVSCPEHFLYRSTCWNNSIWLM